MVDAMDEVQVRRAEVMMPQKESLLKDPAYTLPLNGEQQEVTLLEMDDVELAYGTERSEGRGKLQITSRYALRVSFTPQGRDPICNVLFHVSPGDLSGKTKRTSPRSLTWRFPV
jgi:hypothetical protein